MIQKSYFWTFTHKYLNCNLKNIFHCDTIQSSWDVQKIPMDEWIKKMWCLHTDLHIDTRIEYYTGLKEKEILLNARTWINLEDMFSKISQS